MPLISIKLEGHAAKDSIAHEIKQLGDNDNNWKPAHQLHMTVIPVLGPDFTAQESKIVSDTLAAVTKRHPSFPLEFEDTPSFGFGAVQNRYGIVKIKTNSESYNRFVAFRDDLVKSLKQAGLARQFGHLLPPHVTIYEMPGAFATKQAFTDIPGTQAKVGKIASNLSKMNFQTTLLRCTVRHSGNNEEHFNFAAAPAAPAAPFPKLPATSNAAAAAVDNKDKKEGADNDDDDMMAEFSRAMRLHDDEVRVKAERAAHLAALVAKEKEAKKRAERDVQREREEQAAKARAKEAQLREEQERVFQQIQEKEQARLEHEARLRENAVIQGSVAARKTAENRLAELGGPVPKLKVENKENAAKLAEDKETKDILDKLIQLIGCWHNESDEVLVEIKHYAEIVNAKGTKQMIEQTSGPLHMAFISHRPKMAIVLLQLGGLCGDLKTVCTCASQDDITASAYDRYLNVMELHNNEALKDLVFKQMFSNSEVDLVLDDDDNLDDEDDNDMDFASLDSPRLYTAHYDAKKKDNEGKGKPRSAAADEEEDIARAIQASIQDAVVAGRQRARS